MCSIKIFIPIRIKIEPAIRSVLNGIRFPIFIPNQFPNNEKKKLHKPMQIIAFGDGHNDASMVKYAGTGVAMANAVQALKDVATMVTLSNDEDGIAEALYKLIPEVYN